MIKGVPSVGPERLLVNLSVDIVEDVGTDGSPKVLVSSSSDRREVILARRTTTKPQVHHEVHESFIVHVDVDNHRVTSVRSGPLSKMQSDMRYATTRVCFFHSLFTSKEVQG